MTARRSRPLTILCRRCRDTWVHDTYYCSPCRQKRLYDQQQLEEIRPWLRERREQGPFAPEAWWREKREARRAA